jgi:dolichyl-diphosphooligosaccharide--protein glycosyltransferase
MVEKFRVFTPSAVALTVGEQHSILEGLQLSSLTSSTLWWYHTTGVILAPIAFLAFVYSAAKERKFGKLLLLCWVVIGILTIIIDQFAHVPWQVYLAEGLAVVAIYFYFEKNSTKVIFIIWSMVILIATLGQTRFDYYLAVNVALLTCYVLWKISAVIYKVFQLIGWKAALPQDKNTKASKKSRNKELEEERAFSYFKPKYLSGFLSLIAIFFLAVYPNLLYGQASNKAWDPDNSVVIYRASNPSATAPADWYNSLVWMNSVNSSTGELNTPDPFGNDSFYYSLYDKPADGEAYAYPNTSYGVLSWWDYGHWITFIAHRIPNANPFQSGIGGLGPNGSVVPGASTFMTAQDEANGSAILDKLGSKYVIIDYRTAGIFSSYIDWAQPPSIFGVMPQWAGQDTSDYYDIWFYKVSSGYAPMMVVHPAYYESMCVRLFTFQAQAVIPYTNSTWALSYTELKGTDGGIYKIVNGCGNGFDSDGNPLPFATYEDAAQYVKDHPGYMIAGVETQSNGNNPFLNSAIPLEALKGYKLIHSSDTIVARIGATNISWVEIFEYTDYKH